MFFFIISFSLRRGKDNEENILGIKCETKRDGKILLKNRENCISEEVYVF